MPCLRESSMPVLPEDVITAIIGIIPVEWVYELSALALLSTSFVVPAQTRLFRDVEVYTLIRCSKLLDLLAVNPNLCS
jgi:hypothetical protein